MRIPPLLPADDHGLRTVTNEGNAVKTSYSSLPNKLISASSGVDYAYRDTGGGVACRWFFCSTSAATSTAGIPR